MSTKIMSGLISTILARESKPSDAVETSTARFSQKGFCRTSYCITVVYDEHFKALNIHFITIVKPLNASSTVNVTQDVEF